jgi:putative transposase
MQSHGGSEFLGELTKAATDLSLPHYLNRPNYPQGSRRVERPFRTDEEEFYQVEEPPADLGGPQSALSAWNKVYEGLRPHQALGYLTPDEYYQNWLIDHQRKEVVSYMS